MTRALVKVPKQARAGDVVTVRVLIRHVMESGHRRDRIGELIPRNIVHSFAARYDGEEIVRIDLQPGIAANPYLEFRLVATVSGNIEFEWSDDDGNTHTQTAALKVT